MFQSTLEFGSHSSELDADRRVNSSVLGELGSRSSKFLSIRLGELSNGVKKARRRSHDVR